MFLVEESSMKFCHINSLKTRYLSFIFIYCNFLHILMPLFLKMHLWFISCLPLGNVWKSVVPFRKLHCPEFHLAQILAKLGKTEGPNVYKNTPLELFCVNSIHPRGHPPGLESPPSVNIPYISRSFFIFPRD